MTQFGEMDEDASDSQHYDSEIEREKAINSKKTDPGNFLHFSQPRNIIPISKEFNLDVNLTKNPDSNLTLFN